MKPEFERAAISGDVLALETLLGAGTDIDARDRYGQTALMLAAHHGRLQAVETLLRHGANPDVTAKFNLSALMLAIVARHEAVAGALLRAGTDLEHRGTGAPGFWNKTAYDLAVDRGMAALCAEIMKAKETHA